MASDGKIVFEVTADGKHAIADIKEITRAIEKETKNWDDAAKESTDNIDKSFSSMLKKIAAGFSAAKIGKMLLDLGKEAIDLASDLEEVQNVVDVTFGSQGAKKIETWAKNAGTQFGLTETQAKKFSSTLGAMFKSSGLSGDEITDMSTDLAGLAADMASFYNLDFEEAFGKIRSGMAGMSMPLKELGIDMSVDALNAFAMEKGLSKTFSQMSSGEQTMLRYQYLMKVTADAQGDFSRTSDGFANATRKLETNITSLKANLGKFLLPVVNDLLGSMNKLFGGAEEEANKRFSILDRVAEIDIAKEEKIKEIEMVAKEANSLIDILDRIGSENAAAITVENLAEGLNKLNGSTVDNWENMVAAINNGGSIDEIQDTIKSLEESFLAMGNDSDEAAQGLATLGYTTDEIAEKQEMWLKTVQELGRTIPGLSSMINTNTGKVEGGIPALKQYVDEWERMQKVQEELNALEQLKSTYLAENNVAAKKADMFTKGAIAQIHLQDALKSNSFLGLWYTEEDIEEIISLVEKGAKEALTSEEAEKIAKLKLNLNPLSASGSSELFAEFDEYLKAADVYMTTVDELPKLLEIIEGREKDLEEQTGQTIEELESQAQDAKAATADWTEDLKNKATDAVNAANEALTSLADHMDEVHKKVQNSVDGVIKGFSKIETPMQQNAKNAEKIKEQITQLDSRSKTYAEDLNKLNAELNKYTGEQISAQSMKKNLEQQAQYMDDYLSNLEKARNKGASNDVLAQLSDGSAESFDMLAALAEATPAEVEAINAQWEKVASKKQELTDTLTEQQLTVDQVYQNLLAEAKKAVDELDLEETAKENAGKTIEGIIDGISSHVDGVKDAVDSIITQLDRLKGYGVDFNYDMNTGAVTVLNGKPKIDTSAGKDYIPGAKNGVDYVPGDDLLYRLHEGEAVLTAEENKVWASFKQSAGQGGFDFDTMGGVMRDNVKAGGNVYLDGKVVGNVISDRQGKSFKTLQRSGWQQ